MMLILGKSVKDWEDIYRLKKYNGEKIKDMSDLIGWRSPDTPDDCLKLGLQLVRARSEITDCSEIHRMIEEILKCSI